MTRRVVLILAAALLPCAAQRRRQQKKPPHLEVVQVTARRTPEGVVEFDGRVRNCGERRLERLNLLFHIMAPGAQVITTQRGAVDEEVLDPGQEAEFHWQMKNPPRGVSFEVGASDRSEDHLQVAKAGPYPIE